ncbi:B3 domain-containing transcription repressor VAL2 isoform X2 [Vigna radiata var. radiata]|uniref:B3 domain-containing transcription repressor VAL2 isoform X2 n=1 Tax=Vigna radiata var. radiata TaxID=3916 RepID=A0A1S3T9C2_VIGRR|nr:B3 domain-containing transcription repressor VAL2 isoform X2 [Vigna radiata var. radiata]
MESRSCMNVACATLTTIRWRKGWALRSGEFADLCDKCGSAYEQSTYCDTFHSNDSGWRECTSCDKRLHCGCIASMSQLELLDTGGVSCISCARNSGLQPIAINEKPNGSGTSKVIDVSAQQCTSLANQLNVRGMQGGHYAENDGLRCWFKPHKIETDGPSTEMKPEILPSVGELGSTLISQFHFESNGSSKASKAESCKADTEIRDIYESLAQTNLSMTLATPIGNSNPFHSSVVDEREQSKTSSLLLGSRSRHLLPKPPRSTSGTGLEINAGMVSQIRVARPPAEGRGRNQLLPRYWPRITDQELQQISGDSNSTIVPLFEKMLSASDAGRIGRLVLPKACAEAYFPPISQPEGLPLRIQDVKGKEWMFQFRFWPNNNSRMYVLEGVTPCIQSMQLQAGDTVTFSRMDPEGKLIMGFRKATNSTAVQSQKGCSETHLNVLSKKWNSAGGDMNWHNIDIPESRKREGLPLPPVLVPEKKRTRNIGSKSKRLLIDSQDALELKLTWEEAQDLLRPPPAVKPSIVMIEDQVFEEYEEPPVFGKRSIFVVRSAGVNEQWTQCDSCSKWRKLPVDVLIPPKWTCVENLWDQSRCSCAAPNELNPRELDNLLRLNKEFKKQRFAASQRPALDHESSGLDALANAAILGDDASESGRTPVVTTTKHPRHRPGCSCIVCIQPPSGKGKHKPTCTCNVCMTVKRRFKTLMMRKKKRQSEREAEIAQRNQLAWRTKDESEVDSTSRHLTPVDGLENEVRTPSELDPRTPQDQVAEAAKGQLDLNCQPDREEAQTGPNNVSMTSLLEEANLPLETYLKQNGLTSLISEQQTNSASNVQQAQTTNESEGRQNEDCGTASVIHEQDSSHEDNSGQDKDQNNSLS